MKVTRILNHLQPVNLILHPRKLRWIPKIAILFERRYIQKTSFLVSMLDFGGVVDMLILLGTKHWILDATTLLSHLNFNFLYVPWSKVAILGMVIP